MSKKVYYSCVVDENPKFSWQCFILINSLIDNCRVSPENIFVHLFHLSSPLTDFFSGLGVNVINANRWGDLRYCNKLCQFDSSVLLAADYIFLCDCDMAFVENIENVIDYDSIMGKTVDTANPSIEILEHFFDKYGCKKPEIVDTYIGRSYRTNCNGGLYGIPQKLFDPLGEKWKYYASQMLGDKDAIDSLGDQHIHIDQIAFSMALSDSTFTFKPLETAYNTPTHSKAFLPKIIEVLKTDKPKVLHFHSSIDKIGLLRRVDQKQIDASIDIVNGAIIRNFKNKLFWDFRYAYYPSLGSGIGSRGENLKAKQKMLKLAGIEKAKSVLDVGCGDGEIISPFRINDYTGIDISLEALKLSKVKNPQGTFLDFSKKEMAKDSDLVVCLDVLIHQDTAQDYYDLVDFITNKTKRRLIVSGYSSKERSDKSCMCNYFEDIRITLEKTGQFRRTIKFFEYRNLDVIIAEKKEDLIDTPPYPNDIDPSILDTVIKIHNNQDYLFENVIASRSIFGWFTKHYPRLFEYSWVLEIIGREQFDKVIADFGSGISALPLLLSMRGAKVYTIDHGPEVSLSNIEYKNEWGFFDYSVLDNDIISLNKKLTLDTFPPASLDVWFSVSVIEHLSKIDRLDIFRAMRMSLKNDGRLLLTIDLCKNSDKLWNYSLGLEVEPLETHGTIKTLCDELTKMGFTSIKIQRNSMPDSERVDIAYISAIATANPIDNLALIPENTNEINIDIGGQNNRDDQDGRWKIVDLHEGADYKVNLEYEDLPFEDLSVSNIYSSHCIEHIEPDKLRSVFSEMFRVLKNNGKIRLVVPSFKKGIFYYLFLPWILKRPLMPRLNSNTPKTKMSLLSSWFYTETNKVNGTPGHKTAWDFELLKVYMNEAGFSNVKKCSLKKCSPVFIGKDNPGYRAFSLYVEGKKLNQAFKQGYKSKFSKLKNISFWREKLQLYFNMLIINKSKLFDTPWYLLKYHDVKTRGTNPIKHYLTFGWREGRDPSGIFSTTAYLKERPDLADMGICPLVHFAKEKFKKIEKLDEVIPTQVMKLIEPLNFRSVYELGNKKTNGVPYALYYRALGIEYTSIDLNGLDGSLPLDLSEDIDLPKRDAVLNIGTSEHVLNQKSVFQNIHNLSKIKMIHWVPLATKHPTHGYWGYSIEFFEKLAKINKYKIEKLYIEKSFKNWSLVCCSYKKSLSTIKNFQWPENHTQLLKFNEGGSGGVDYT